jgi:hypothetical protein
MHKIPLLGEHPLGDNSVNMGMPVGEVTERLRRAHHGRNTTISV